MRFGGRLALALIWLGGSLVFGQVATPPDQAVPPVEQAVPATEPASPAAEPTGPPAEPTRPLTPEEERDQQIQQFDPLAKDKDQESLDKAAREAQRKRDEELKPLPGSIADTENQNAADKPGPRIDSGDGSGGEEANEPAYTGPAVLSRSYTVNQSIVPSDVRWQEIFGLNAFLDTSATGSVTASGQTMFPILSGMQTTLSLRARHVWKREQLAVAFNNSDSHYFGPVESNGVYSGSNYSLSVNYGQVLTRHLNLNVIFSGVLFSQNYALENPNGAQTDVANISIASSPNVQIFDNGTKQFNSSINLTYQQSARLSYSVGIGYFAVEQNAPGYLGTTGEQARGDVNYRLTRNITVGTYYSWNYYLLPDGVGQTTTNTIGLIYSWAITRSMQLRLRGGGSQVQSVGLETIAVNPAIAFLLGQNSGIIDSYTKLSTTDISAQLVKDLGSSRTASLSYAKGISPGNGLYQASEQESIGASFRTVIRRFYTVSFSAGRDTLKSVSQTLGTYGSTSASLIVGRALGHGLSMNFNATVRRLDITDFPTLTPLHDQYLFAMGFTYTPGDGRLFPRI